ncbi:MAG: UDP-N-acetylmuramate:L-alanyl-gamma-D-glutamyl-meso-diaminopimelate ligase [Magnetococcales bacterium]|nr:UDP-N-acetylmuramate:L-alanyl-gamma-D-glutamyl-meso-diaminopimelate ligase [Magnetococcales bacterium]
MTHLHIIGICGTAMAGIAALARDAGMRVTGSDSGVYPPMSDFLAELEIEVFEGFRPANLDPAPDQVLVGNAISRGNPELEALMDRGIPYRSGAEWLFENLLERRHPVVVTGTHGKTTTSSIMAHVWEQAGLKPGFMIGGIPRDFGRGVRYPGGEWVVVEGDEYDTAFFDKRPKFLHYRPKTLILHNLEYDHADIYDDLEAIRRQFRLLLRTVPGSGLILANGDDPEIEALAEQAFSPVVRYGFGEGLPFQARLDSPDGRRWTVLREGKEALSVSWNMLGRHNVMNGLAAAAAALSHNLDAEMVAEALNGFQGVARRLQLCFEIGGISVYDDFAHHPTAIETTLKGMHAMVGDSGRVWAVVEPRSNTMRRRIHQDRLAAALAPADRVLITRPAARGLPPEELLDVETIVRDLNAGSGEAVVIADVEEALAQLGGQLATGDHVVVMSNGGFGGIHERLRDLLT